MPDLQKCFKMILLGAHCLALSTYQCFKRTLYLYPISEYIAQPCTIFYGCCAIFAVSNYHYSQFSDGSNNKSPPPNFPTPYLRSNMGIRLPLFTYANIYFKLSSLPKLQVIKALSHFNFQLNQYLTTLGSFYESFLVLCQLLLK